MKIGPKYKIARRLGAPIFEKTQTQKFALHESRKRPKRGRRPSDYGLQMIEKQKARFTYLLSERQFANYVKKAMSAKGSDVAETLYQKLERRLDNAVFRAGFAHTRLLARQMVSHGHIYVNGRRTNISSFEVSPEDIISIRKESLQKVLFSDLDERMQNYKQPAWIKYDAKKREAQIEALPEMHADDLLFDLTSVLEFYSR